MKKIRYVAITVILCVLQFGCAPTWTEEKARGEAFKNLPSTIDVSQYPAVDPNFQENQKALESGNGRVADRFVSKNPEPPVGYVVSTLDEKNRPRVTMFYGSDGRLISIRLFSRPEYPRVAYIYCVSEKDCRDGNREYKRGEVMSVSFHISGREAFYFRPNGQCTGHVKF